jgi:hypothetical protein
MVALFGRANWWLPSWLARPLRIRAGTGVPARPEQAPTGDDLMVTGVR